MALQRRMQVLDGGIDDEPPIEEFGLKVAFASTDLQTVNQHFGSAKSIAIYVVTPDDAVLLEVVEFTKAESAEEDKLTDKLDVLQGCIAVYSQAIGSSAMQKLVQQGIQPIKISEGTPIKVLIEALQEEIKLGPSTWLAKAIERGRGPMAGRFDTMEAEGWDE